MSYCNFMQNFCITFTMSWDVLYRDCLHDHIMGCQDADVKCPCNVNDEVTCEGSITEAEMRSVRDIF